MAISRFQMNRQLRAYGGMMGDDGRKAYGIGSFFQKKIMDPIKKVVKSDAGKAVAALTAANFAPKIIPGGSNQTLLQRFLPSVSQGLETARGAVSNIFKPRGSTTDTERVIMNPKEVEEGAEPIYQNFPKKGDGILKTIGKTLTTNIPGTEKSIAGLLMTPQALALGSGLLAGAFTKDKEDPIYTGQDVGLNLQDIAKLANISDPKVASAIGLRFSPDVEARKFTPEEMAAAYAANAPQDFTEKREQARKGGIMGDQKDFEEFLQEDKDGGIMKARPKMASYGYNDAMSDTYSSYLEMKKKGLIPQNMTFDEFIQEVVPEMSKRQDTSGMMASAILGDESDEISMGMFGKPVKELNPSEFQELMDYLDDLQKSFMAEGGIMKAKPKKISYGFDDAMAESFAAFQEARKNGLIPLTMEFDEYLEIMREKMADGGMMNLGGMEMDLRGGGFVPMGAKEKADDVPARLSKNEFVFTADAVRAAGGGDVDKGADKMYATMKKLEDRIA